MIVRDAARVVLAASAPVRVVRHGEFLGVVDSEAILRVIVAEDAGRAGDARAAEEPVPSQRSVALGR